MVPTSTPKRRSTEASAMLASLQTGQQGLEGRIEEKELVSLPRGQLQDPVFPGKPWKCDRDPLPSSEAETMYIQMSFTLKQIIPMLGSISPIFTWTEEETQVI